MGSYPFESDLNYSKTDYFPAYHRQVVVMTAPHIGNTGWNQEDNESSKIWVSGFVVRNPSPVTSNWRSENSLEAELRSQGIIGISGLQELGIGLIAGIALDATIIRLLLLPATMVLLGKWNWSHPRIRGSRTNF